MLRTTLLRTVRQTVPSSTATTNLILKAATARFLNTSATTALNGDVSDVSTVIPADLLFNNHPKPVRREIIESDHPLVTKDLESFDVKLDLHRVPATLSDRIAFWTVKTLRMPADLFFKKKYIHRAVMLETVAAVPGMVGASLRHLKSLRRMRHDGGWIEHLLHEAENERMHLMTWMRFSQPALWERALVTAVQGMFYNAFFALYLISPRTAHRVVGYLEEEAIVSYTSFLNEIDKGNIENTKDVPDIAIDYWNLDPKTATLRDVVLAVRADEATHRDTNHHFADRIVMKREDLREDIKRVFADALKDGSARKLPGGSSAARSKWER